MKPGRARQLMERLLELKEAIASTDPEPVPRMGTEMEEAEATFSKEWPIQRRRIEALRLRGRSTCT